MLAEHAVVKVLTNKLKWMDDFLVAQELVFFSHDYDDYYVIKVW